jgi:molybdopterin-containing oxidoreductase family iron-sulfur binding subunit
MGEREQPGDLIEISEAIPKPQQKSAPMDLEAVRAKLAGKNGRAYWRSLEELAETPEFTEFLHREFPENHSEWHDGPGRRNFLKLMGASLAFAGLSACTKQPPEKIVPYVRAPEEFIPGIPLQYATAMTLGGYARGVLATSHMGRPTKLEGNELHPASLGSSDIFMQASILQLYDPDRSQVVQNAGRISTWSEFLAAAMRALAAQKAKKGAGLRILTETVTSPTLANQIQTFLKDYPEAKWHQYEPVNRDMARAGARVAFGADVDTQYRFDKANVILSLDADFLNTGPASIRHTRDFSSRRNARIDAKNLNRLYAIESSPSLTGGMADHRMVTRAAEVESFAREIAKRLGVAVSTASDADAKHGKWMDAVVRDLQRNRGASIVIAGEHQSAMVHALAHAMNAALGNTGSTVIYTDAVEAKPEIQTESLKTLAGDMAAGRVEVLLMLGGNPAYNAPVDLNFAAAMDKVGFRAHLSLYEDETSNLCHWHVPDVHFLEAWGDARAFDGTVTIQQPLIAPLYGAKSALEVLSALSGKPGVSGYDIVRNYWKSRIPAADFEKTWRSAVHDGVMPGTALPAKSVAIKKDFATGIAPPPVPASLVEVNFRPDPTIFDGRFANSGWLQELPKPLTKLTWDNAALVSEATAKKLGVQNENVVEMHCEGKTLRAPIWILPGHPDDSVTLHFGYGRTRAGRVGSGAGFNAYALRRSDAPWFCSNLEIIKTGEKYQLAITQNHSSMEGRNLVREGSVEEYEKHPDFVREMGEEPPKEMSLYPEHKYTGYAWGMAIDLTACVGCNACATACQAENNIPIVGKTQVRNAREMHWIRVDRYFEGPAEEPNVVHQPVPCMHCENAPCEVVCPVAATSHSAEGLNDMVYNRCVGTRYCSNNCPYKVRRFNFLKYTDDETPVLKLLRNPNVTVRTRGVMEKCTYCVQRINEARITAEKESRAVRDGEIVTACQQACPARAIVFGDVNDPKSEVSKLKASKLNYGLLAELNTQPRTTYLAKLRNPNPEISGEW